MEICIALVKKWNIILLALLILLFSSCEQEEYYIDGGKAKPFYNGSILQYLDSKPVEFDTIALIVRLAGMEEVFTEEVITFFAPTDAVIKQTIGAVSDGGLNQELYSLGKDTIQALDEISPEIWKKYLSRYIFKGANKLKDYPQIDFSLIQVFPGAYYYAYNQDVFNIGVVYNDANGVKYIGYRQLTISFIPDNSQLDKYIPAAVASSDIQATNGVVHVLAWSQGNSIGNASANFFGFGSEFSQDVSINR